MRQSAAPAEPERWKYSEGCISHSGSFGHRVDERRGFFRPRLSLPGSAPGCQPHFLGVFGFNGTKPAFKAGFAGTPAQVGMTP